MVLIGGGVFLLLALLCGGGGFGAYLMFRSDRKPDDKILSVTPATNLVTAELRLRR